MHIIQPLPPTWLVPSTPVRRVGNVSSPENKDQKHSLRHNDVRYPCETCGKDFNTPRDLRKHIARHLNKKLILCPVCARSLTSEMHLKLHMRTHDKVIDESDTICNICSKSFADIYNLRFHMQTHSRDFSGRRAQVLCNICSKLILKASLRQHMEHKHGEIKYAECEFCGAKLRDTYIKQHQQLCNATEEERAAFKAAQQKSCDICGKVLSNNSKLKRHMKTHEPHGIAVRYNRHMGKSVDKPFAKFSISATAAHRFHYSVPVILPFIGIALPPMIAMS